MMSPGEDIANRLEPEDTGWWCEDTKDTIIKVGDRLVIKHQIHIDEAESIISAVLQAARGEYGD